MHSTLVQPPGADDAAAPDPRAHTRADTRLGGSRDRFLAFAFAAADMLVECAADGLITYAAGAFRARFGRDTGHFVGRHASVLVAAPEQPAFAMALAALGLRGRIAPLLVRLADPGGTIACLSAMAMPGPPTRLCLTFGPPPAAADPHPGAARMNAGAGALSQAAALRLRGEPGLREGGARGEVGLVELKGWQRAKESMSAADQQVLRQEITTMLGGASAGALASEMAEGRFGVLAEDSLDMEGLVERLEQVVAASPAGRHARVAGAEVSLDAGGLAPAQAARALRFALSRFAQGGLEAALAAGSADGLAAIMARAELRARTVQQAIAGGRFRLMFQPVVRLSDRSVHHFEALLRPSATPGSPVQTPQDFVTFTETVGLAESLDLAVLEQARRVLGRRDGPTVAVNISGVSMQSRAFGAAVVEMLAQPGLPARLMFELTETAEIEDMEVAVANMAQFRALGVPLCLDDFGAGAAAFRYLRDFQVDLVKIDGDYVHSAPRSARERGLLVSMVDLARSVNARTVAEKIETEEQARLVTTLGVELGQGWLFGRPGSLPGAAEGVF